MGMGKYPPGPWKVADESGNMGEAFVIESKDRTIAWTANSIDPDDEGEEIITEEDRDIAKLIAQAPELLETLDDVTAALETMLAWETRERKLMFTKDRKQRENLVARARKLTDAWRQEPVCEDCGETEEECMCDFAVKGWR